LIGGGLRIGEQEARDVQELRLVFPNAVDLEAIRRFAKEFIA
jgi:hypothetical protein